MKATERTIQAGKFALATWAVGEGTPVVALGGPWLGHSYLQPLAEHLARNFRVITYDARGSGRSSGLTGDQISLDGHVDDLETLRVGFGLERLNLVGHSFGAHVSMLYAARRPQTTASLILANPGPPLDRAMQETLHRAFVNGHTDEEKRRLKEIESSPGFTSKDPRTHEEYMRILYASFFKDRKYFLGLQFEFTPTTALYALGAEQQLVHQLMAGDPAGTLRSINCPTLVIHAEHDLIPEAFSRSVADGIRDAEYAKLTGVGHFGYLENPALFTRTLVAFLESHAR